ncbi:MAG: hypothetical protein HQL46_03570 [Gammaproteobacteria bacterium]|nr:hypothetical protein [Gammaproteobacteria bacterium]
MDLTTEKGFSIVELLIASTLSLIIILSVLTVYVNATNDSAQLLKHVQFNEEMNALSQIISNDIKRAGFWAHAKELNDFSENPFVTFSVLPDGTKYFPFSINLANNGQCISFAYDADEHDGKNLQTSDLFAYRLKDKQIQVLSSVNFDNFAKAPCANDSGQWMSLSDKTFMQISELKFSLVGSQCLNMRTQEIAQLNNNIQPSACSELKNTAGDRLLEMRFITLSITGKLSQLSDTISSNEMEKTIQISAPNHHIYIEPSAQPNS